MLGVNNEEKVVVLKSGQVVVVLVLKDRQLIYRSIYL